MSTQNMSVLLTANDAQLRQALQRSGREVRQFADQVRAADGETVKTARSMKSMLGPAGLAVGSAFGLAVTMTVAFEAQMRNVNSISRLTERQLAALSSEVIKLSTRLPQSAAALAEGLYDIASSGYAGADGLKVLEAAATAATAGLTDTQTAAQAITTVLNAYGLAAADAGYVSDVLFSGVNAGVVTFEQLAGGLGDVVGFAAAAGVQIDSVTSAVATMTLAGIGANEATTSLNRLLQSLVQPSEELGRMLAEQGYQTGYAALQALGLHGVMELVRKTTGGNVEALLKLFPEIRAARGAFALMANAGANYNKVAAAIEDKNAVAGATQKAFNEQMKGFGMQLKLVANRAKGLGIELGMKLLPALNNALRALTDLAAAGGELAANLGRHLAPAWDSLTKAFASAVAVLGEVLRFLKPLAASLLLITEVGVVAFATAFAAALESLAGFVEKNKWLVDALASVLAVRLVTALYAATAALATAKWSAFATVVSTLITRARLAVAQFLLMAQLAGGGLVGAFKAAQAALMGFLSSPAGMVTVFLAGLYLIYGAIERNRAAGKRWAADFVSGLKIDTSSLASMSSGLDAINKKAEELRSKPASQAGGALGWVRDYAKTVGDELLNVVGAGDAITDSWWDTWAQLQGLTSDEKDKLVKQYQSLQAELVKTWDDSGLAAAYNKQWGLTLQLSEETAKAVEAQWGITLKRVRGASMVSITPDDPNYSKVAASTGVITDQLDELAKAAQSAGIDLGSAGFAGKLTEIITATSGLPPAGQEAAMAIMAVTDAADIGADKVEALKTALDSLVDAALGVEEAQDQYTGAINAMIAAAKNANGARVDFGGQTDEALRFRDATRGVVDEMAKVIEAYAGAGATGEQLQGVLTLLTEDFYNQAVAAGVPADKAREYADILKSLPPEVLIKFNKSEIDGLLEAARSGKAAVEGIDERAVVPEVGLDNSQFTETADAVNRSLDALGSRVVRPRVVLGEADGGTLWTTPSPVIYAHAKGGVREDHSAQIAPAGAMRLWAEPETGGEAYIPLGSAKRARSVSILRDVAKRFGYKLEVFAAGGIIADERQRVNEVNFYASALRGRKSFINAAAQARRDVGPLDLSRVTDPAERGRMTAEHAARQQEAVQRALHDTAETYNEVRRAAGKTAAEQLANSGLAGDAYQKAASRIIQAAEQRKAADKEAAAESTAVYKAMQDDDFKRGELSARQYAAILRRRIAGTKKYTQEWLELNRQLYDVQKQEADRQQGEVQSRADRAGSSGVGLVGALSGKAGVSPADIKAYLAHAADAGKEFDTLVKQLRDKGYDQGIISQVISQGPQAIPFARALLQTDARATNQKLGVIAGYEASIANQSTKVVDQSAKVTIGSVSFEINGAGVGQLTEAQLRRIVGDGVGRIAVQVRQGTGG